MTPAPEPPPWLDELDLHVGPPDATVGTRSLDLADWFLVDDDWEPQRAEAARLVASARDEVVVGVDDPAVRGPSEELLALVERLLLPSPGTGRASVAPPPGTGRASVAGPSGTGRASVAPPPGTGRASVAGPLQTGRASVAGPVRTGRGSVAPVAHPLVDARLLVADDLCVLLPDGPRWVLAAGCVCFPSYWRPQDKVGRPLAEVHTPVPGYPGAFADRVDGFLGRLAPGRAAWRRNWLVHDVPDLHLPMPDATQARPVPGGGATVARPVSGEGATVARPVSEGRWLRSERQVLVKLVEHDAVVFGIRTQQVPIAVLAGRPDIARGLAAALRGWSPAQRSYKGRAVDGSLLAWLDAVS